MMASDDAFRKFMGPPRKRAHSVNGKVWQELLDEARACISSGEFGGLRPRGFVALYAVLHEQVYGVAPAELGPKERASASCAAARMLEKEFGTLPSEMAEFMRWAWIRERGREKWRRDNGKPGGRITWRLMFGGNLLTDWRVEGQRKGAAR